MAGASRGCGARALVRAFAARVALAALLLAGPAREARAVLTFDLLQDTPRTRELLRDELGSAAPAAPDAAAPVAAAGLGGGAGRGDLAAIWQAREKALEIGESEKAQQQLEALWAAAIERGIRNLPEYSTVLVREARRRMESRDFDQAARALGFARRIAPDELPVYTTAALLAVRRNPLNIVPAWEELAQGLRAVGRSFRLQVWLRANALLTLQAGLAFFFAFAVGTLMVVNAPRLAHELREAIRVGSPRTRLALAWIALASPALVGLSPWWWAILGGLVLWPYLERPQQGLLAAAAAFTLALPLFVNEAAALIALPGRPLLETIVRVREGHWTQADYQLLKQHAEKGTAGIPGVTALGLAARRLGLLDEAEAACRAGLQAAPGDAALWNNLGSVAFARGDMPGAVAGFSKAVEVAPLLFAPHYNLGLAYRESFKFAEGEAESHRASEIDPEAAAFYAGLDASRLKGFSVDALPPLAPLWSLARLRDEEQEAAADGLWQSLMLGPSAATWPWVIAALLALGGALGAWRLRRGPAGQCPRCGRVFCPGCQTGTRGGLCSQCHHIFVKKEGVDARVRVQKMGEIKAHHRVLRIRHIALAALAPGGGHLSAGRFWTGVAFLLPASFFEARVILGHGAFPSPWSLGSAAGAWFASLGAVAFGLWWGASLWLATRLEE